MTKQWHLPLSITPPYVPHFGGATRYALCVCFCNLISFPLLNFASIYTLETYAAARTAVPLTFH